MSVSTVLPAIRAALLAKVQGVTGISGVAPVYDYWRHVTTEDELRTLFKGASQSRVHWWCVALATQEPASIWNLNGCDQANPAKFDIHGYYALQDSAASEKAFQTIVMAVLDTLLADKNLQLPSPVAGVIGMDPLPAWVENDPRMLAGVLLHHARIAVGIRAQVS